MRITWTMTPTDGHLAGQGHWLADTADGEFAEPLVELATVYAALHLRVEPLGRMWDLPPCTLSYWSRDDRKLRVFFNDGHGPRYAVIQGLEMEEER